MPYAIDGHVMIDRLVYPTLGNPNLYVKSDPSDEFDCGAGNQVVEPQRRAQPAAADLAAGHGNRQRHHQSRFEPRPASPPPAAPTAGAGGALAPAGAPSTGQKS